MTDPISLYAGMAKSLEDCPPPDEREARLKMVMAADALRKAANHIDAQDDRIEELEAACEIVSAEFEGELWQACRRILDKTHFDFNGVFPDGIQADTFEGHMEETLAELDRSEVKRRAQAATIKALVEALERIASRHVTKSPLWWQVEARAAIAAARVPK